MDLQELHHIRRGRGVNLKRNGCGMKRRWHRAHLMLAPRWTHTNGPPHLFTLQFGAWTRPHLGHFQP